MFVDLVNFPGEILMSVFLSVSFWSLEGTAMDFGGIDFSVSREIIKI